MTDLTQLISVLQGIEAELLKVREEIHAAGFEIRRGLKTATSGPKNDESNGTPETEQSHEEWLKEAASRSSKKLFQKT